MSDLEEQLKAKNKWIAQLLEQVDILKRTIVQTQKDFKEFNSALEKVNDLTLDKIDIMNEKIEADK